MPKNSKTEGLGMEWFGDTEDVQRKRKISKT